MDIVPHVCDGISCDAMSLHLHQENGSHRAEALPPARVGEEGTMEYEFQWRGKQDIRLLIQPFPVTWRWVPALDTLSKALSWLTTLKVHTSLSC